MPNEHSHSSSSSPNLERRGARWTVAALMVVVIVLFYILREHWAHALGMLPYALLLACPLMHLFHGGHGHHAGRRSGRGDSNDPRRH